MAKYKIPEVNFPKLEAHIEKLAKQAVKLGCLPITMTVGGYVDQPRSELDGLLVRVYDVEVTGTTPVINGWWFIARIEHLDEGNILYMVEGEHPPEWARTTEPKCDHCKTDRKRKDTFLVRHEDGDVKQIGSTCLADFLGHHDPQGLAAMAQDIAMLDGFIDECSGYDPDAMPAYEHLYRLETYLAYVCQSICKHGWMSRGKAVPGFDVATADDASFTLHRSKDDERPSDKDRQETAEAIVWAKEYFVVGNGLNDYEWNVAQIIKLDAIRSKHFGLAASIVPAYHRELERRARDASKNICNEYVGEIKKRQIWTGLTVEAIIPIGSHYGVSRLHKMRDPEGHLLVWFASNFEAEPGDVLSGKGTVKEHKEYKGEKQTVLTRCKFKIQ